MSQPQTSEDVVWIPDYDDIDPVEVEADLRRREERQNPKKFEQERLNEFAKKAEAARISAERQEYEQKAAVGKVEPLLETENQEFKLAEQRSIAERQQSEQRLEELRRAELEQARAELEKAKAEAEKAKTEAVTAKIEAENARTTAERVMAAANQIQPSSLENPPPNPSAFAQEPPWGNGFGSFQDTKSTNRGPILSPLFVSDSTSSSTPQGSATPVSNNPPVVKKPEKRKPLLGAAFGGDKDNAS